MLRLSILFAASLLTVPLTATAPRGLTRVRDAVGRSDASSPHTRSDLPTDPRPAANWWADIW